jgi:DNA polymerase III epsilon subunit-like protein
MNCVRWWLAGQHSQKRRRRESLDCSFWTTADLVQYWQLVGQGPCTADTSIAVDCEMVGLGHLGSESALARVSLVNYHGHVLLDTFVQPRERVTDWRTWVSGIRESDMVGAPTFAEVQKQVAELVEGRILIGHAIENDLKVIQT